PGHGRQRTTSLATMDQPVPILGVSPDPDSDEPIVVERMRARSKDSLTTRQIIVVRQGDRVLSVIKPTRDRHASADWPLEEDLERWGGPEPRARRATGAAAPRATTRRRSRWRSRGAPPRGPRSPGGGPAARRPGAPARAA